MSIKDVSQDLLSLTDEQIVQRLRDEFNYNPGPILPTTRKTYLKKLQTFMNDSKRPASRASAVGTTHRSGSSSRSSSASRRRETHSQAKPTDDLPKRSSIGRPSTAASRSNEPSLLNITDEELVRRLAEYDFKCGPLNDMTRTVYIKRLKGLIDSGSVPNEKPVAAKSKRKSAVEVPNDFVKSIARNEDIEPLNTTSKLKSILFAAIYSNYILFAFLLLFLFLAGRSSPRLSLGRKSKIVTKYLSTAYSDSDAEEPSTSQGPATPTIDPLEMRRGANLVRKSISNRFSLNPTLTTTTTSKYIPAKSARSSLRDSAQTSANTQQPDYSESDDIDRNGGVLYIQKARKSPASTPLQPSTLVNFSDSDNDTVGLEFNTRTKHRTSDSEDVSRLLNYRATRRTVSSAKDEEYKKSFAFSKPPSIVTQAKRSVSSNNSSDSYSTKTNKVSISIVAGILLFFVFIASVYVYNCYFTKADNVEVVELEREFNIKYSEINLPDCSPDDVHNQSTDTISKAYCSDSPAALKPVLLIIKEMRSLVDEQFRQRYCSQDNTKPSDHIYEHDVADLKSKLERTILARVLKLVQYKENVSRPSDRALFMSLFNDALSVLAANARWHLKPIGSGSQFTKIINEQLYPTGLDLSCWTKFALLEYWKVVVAFAMILLAVLWSFVRKWFKVSETKYKEQVNDLVSKCCAHLRKEAVPIPVLHLRDTFFGPNERNKMSVKRLWADVVKFVQSNESRVKVAIDNIDGEDFRTWTWVGQEGVDSGAGTRPSMSRSIGVADQSLHSTTANYDQTTNRISRTPKNFCALTPFLKARIMTNNVVSEWDKNRVHNDILERIASQCEDGKSHNILHLRIESRNPCIVYIKCDSLDSATVAFQALNNWVYRDGQILVKFLQEDRYYIRYPDAQRATTPLQYV